ncbi:MAG: hypothetical protein Q8M76_17655, partial [Spirochaetaceae bacterium]|nr:hypothetical protein [Spirochaetaceae bacterium]
MKKRSIAIAFLLLCATLFAGAQSLKDNQYLKRSTELRALADKAFDEGEYDDAARLASEAAEQARLSNRFVEESIIKLDAERWLKKADAAFTRAIASDAPSRRPAEYAAAATDLVAAREAYANQDYFAARDRARAAEAGCNLIAQADAREAIAKAEEEDAYLTRVGAAKAFTQLVSSGTYELVAARDSYGRSDWAMAATRAQGASAAFARAIDADAQAAIDGAFGDLAWARSVGAQDLYPEDFALAQDALTSALDSSSESLPRLAAAAARTSSLAVSEIARKDAMAAIAKAKEGTAWALAVSADYGAEYERATSAVADADGAFERGEWRVASERARA